MTQKAKRRQKRRKQQEKLDKKNWATVLNTILGAYRQSPRLKITAANRFGASIEEGIKRLAAEIPTEDFQETVTALNNQISSAFALPSHVLYPSVRINPCRHLSPFYFETRQRLRHSIAFAFNVSIDEAERLRQEFCRDRFISDRAFYDYLSSGQIVMHPNGSLAINPSFQTWTIVNNLVTVFTGNVGTESMELIGIGLQASAGTAVVRFRVFDGIVHRQGSQLWLNKTLLLGEVQGFEIETDNPDFTVFLFRFSYDIEETEMFNGNVIHRVLRILRDFQPHHQALVEASEMLKTPEKKQHPCKGCRHYVGRTFFGEKGANPFICAMHPEGTEGKACPDWTGLKI